MSTHPLSLDETLLTRAKNASAIPSFPESLEGQFVRLQPLDPQQQGQALYMASNGTGPNGEPDAYDADALIWRYMFGGPYQDMASFKTYLQDRIAENNGLPLCVIDRAHNRPFGIATYCNNVPSHLRIELGGIWYSPAYQRTWANTETIYLMLKHAFETLGYRRVEWKCDALNERSRKAALRLGFQFEGIFAKHMIVKGLNRDTAWFAITDALWPEAKARLESYLNPE